jgi:hypothetical protein
MGEVGAAEAFSKLLEPLVVSIVEKVMKSRPTPQAEEKLAYTEEEAAKLLSLSRWQLRDERYRGRIQASQVVGKRPRYTRADLEAYLATGRN